MKPKQSFIFIRHAESLFNQGHLIPESRSTVFYDPKLIDCDITEKGILQTEEAKKQVRSLRISKVYVSPLKRALKTAKLVFEGHPDNPKFVVVPYFRERVLATCDLSEYIDEPLKGFEDFDWNLMKEKDLQSKNYWIFDEVQDVKGLGLENLKIEGKKQQQDLLIEKLKEKFLELKEDFIPKMNTLEDQEHFYKNVEKMYAFLLKAKENCKEEDEKKIAVVGHGGNFYTFVLELIKNGYNYQVTDGIFANCQLKEFLI